MEESLKELEAESVDIFYLHVSMRGKEGAGDGDEMHGQGANFRRVTVGLM